MGNYSGRTIHKVIFDCYKYGLINKNWVKLHAHLLAVFLHEIIYSEIRKLRKHQSIRTLAFCNSLSKKKHIKLCTYISNKNCV